MAEIAIIRQVQKPGGLAMPNIAASAKQAKYIEDAFGGAAVIYPPGSAPGGSPPQEFFYRAGFLLTRERDQQNVLNALAALAGLSNGVVTLEGGELHDHPIPGLALIRLRFNIDPKGQDEQQDAARVLFDALEAIERQLGTGTVAPDHLVSVAQNGPTVVGWCPATEPVLPSAGAPPQPGVSRSRCDGRGTLVAVVDGGLVPDAPSTHPWMHGVTGEPDLLAPVGGPIKPYGGHGTFIASIIRAMAPRADVRVARVLKDAGAAFESDVVRALLPVLDWAPDVISLSAGTHTWKSAGLLSFHVFVDGPLREHDGTVLVAAAGNDGADWKFSPAEMEPVIGVGALGPPGDVRASFSDYGDWVKVYAPGVGLVHAFDSGTYTYMQPPANQTATATFHGMATWSGTSFSTPIVAGLIAARMSGTGESARHAADSLLRLARAQALPGLGPVLRPGQACLHLCEQPGCAHACRRACDCTRPGAECGTPRDF
jgi:subtilisin family serine protease